MGFKAVHSGEPLWHMGLWFFFCFFLFFFFFSSSSSSTGFADFDDKVEIMRNGLLFFVDFIDV